MSSPPRLRQSVANVTCKETQFSTATKPKVKVSAYRQKMTLEKSARNIRVYVFSVFFFFNSHGPKREVPGNLEL